MTSNLMTIAEAAKRLGCARPKLSALLSDAKVQKVRVEGRDLIAFADAERVFKDAARSGRVRGQRQGASRAASGPIGLGYDALIKHYQTEVTRLHEEVVRVQSQRDALSVRLSGLEDEMLVLQSGGRQGASGARQDAQETPQQPKAPRRRWVERFFGAEHPPS